MKQTILVVFVALGLALASPADARERGSKRTFTDSGTTTSMAAPERSASSNGGGSTRFGLGVSSIVPVPSGNADIDGSLTAMIDLTGLDVVQLFASIPSTAGSFRFGVGALYKRTVSGNQGAGFHVGGGLGIGTNGEFAMSILGALGVHYAPGGSNVLFSLDGGPAFFIDKSGGGATTSTSFGIGTFSSLLGASIAYMF